MCPACGDTVPADSVWLFAGKLYCSEGCAMTAVYRQADPVIVAETDARTRE